jgi:hypothetical protein
LQTSSIYPACSHVISNVPFTNLARQEGFMNHDS